MAADMKTTPYCAFEGFKRIGSGELLDVALKAKKVVDRGERAPLLVFDNATGEQVEIDFRGTPDQVAKRIRARAMEAKIEPESDPETLKKVGRPKLGVTAREVTLLPRHWEWLNRQPGGASVTLRKLVEEARRVNEKPEQIRQAQEAAYKFMVAVAGNQRGLEEAARALFARNGKKFDAMIEAWPADVREQVRMLAEVAF